jgi:hypothetical protein
MNIGRKYNGDELFNGGLDELAVYPAALSSARVSAHFTARVTLPGTITAATYNAHVADNLTWRHTGLLLYLPTPSEDLTAAGKVHGFRSGAFCVPVIANGVGTLNSMAYRSDTANGKVDLGIYLDDGNGTTCSKISTTGLTAMPPGAGSKQISLAQPAPITTYQKYWLVMGFAITKSGSGGKLGTVLGTDGPTTLLCRRAVNVMPLPTVITFETTNPVDPAAVPPTPIIPTSTPCLAAFP